MALPVWGNLEKSQIDDEKIEEAIARLIQAHEDDPDAHVEAGESLHSHKASAIIDHLALSIIADKIKKGEVTVQKLDWDKFLIQTGFETLDGWQQGGVGSETITCVVGGTKLRTGAVNNDTAYIAAVPNYGMGPQADFDKDPVFQIRLRIMDKGYAEVHVHTGNEGFQSAGNDYIGFRFDQDKIYAVCRESSLSETAVDITGSINSEDPHDYKVMYYATNKVEFYIDGVLKTTITNNIPWGDNEDAIMFIGVKNSHDGGQQSMGVERAIFYQST